MKVLTQRLILRAKIASSQLPPRRRDPEHRVVSAAAYGTKYNSDWESNFLFISRGKEDKVYSFYCKLCQKDVSCRHQGDVKRHEKSNNHAIRVKSLDGIKQ